MVVIGLVEGGFINLELLTLTLIVELADKVVENAEILNTSYVL